MAQAGPDQVLVDGDGGGDEPVTLDGSGSSDADGTITEYRWSEGTTVLAQGASAAAAVSLGVGVHNVTLTVTDNSGATATDTVIITVKGVLPVIAAIADRWIIAGSAYTCTPSLNPRRNAGDVVSGNWAIGHDHRPRHRGGELA